LAKPGLAADQIVPIGTDGEGRGMETTDESRLRKGSRFKSTLDGVPVILEIDEVVMVDESKGEAVLKTHVVGTYETEEEEEEDKTEVEEETSDETGVEEKTS
jgi:hypothetical protein